MTSRPRFCAETWVVRMGPVSGPVIEACYTCDLSARHGGFHHDPELGYWHPPVGDNGLFIAERMPAPADSGEARVTETTRASDAGFAVHCGNCRRTLGINQHPIAEHPCPTCGSWDRLITPIDEAAI